MKLFDEGLAENDPFAILNFSHSFVQREMDLVRHYARGAGVSEEELGWATGPVWNWPKIVSNRLDEHWRTCLRPLRHR